MHPAKRATACLALCVATMCAVTACTSAVSGRGDRRAESPAPATSPHSRTTQPTEAQTSPSSPSPSSPTASSPAATSPDAPPSERTSAAPVRPRAGAVRRALSRMTLAQKVGQLLMVDCPSTGVAAATVTAIRAYHVGSVILDGTTTQGVAATAAVTARLRAVARRRVGLFIATDQEGGLVQRLQGPGFSTIPSALQQGQWTPRQLQQAATIWARQLQRAGLNVNLAPVLDTVPPGFGSNPPVGDLDREYGHRPIRVSRHGLAFAAGMRAAGVAATGKHFPGLGRVQGNTDTSSAVTDPITTRNDSYLRPFAAAAAAGIPFLMVGTAIYSQIDPGVQATFSRPIVTGMLRDDLGYRGVIISDDLGAAAQVSSVPVGQRAVRFVAAGGDIVLTVDASQAGQMTHALLARARNVPHFRAVVNTAALTVLRAKQAAGLLH